MLLFYIEGKKQFINKLETFNLFVVFLFHSIIITSSSCNKSLLLGISVGSPLGVRLLNTLLVGFVVVGESGGLLAGGVLSDRGMHRLVQLLKVVSLLVSLDVFSEVLLVVLLIILLHFTHVIGDVLTEDVALVHLGVEGLGVTVVAGEALVAVGDIESTIGGTLEGSEDTGTSGGVLDANVKEGAEGLLVGLLVELVDVVSLAIVTLGGDDVTGDVLVADVDL